MDCVIHPLQQYLPFTVLKLFTDFFFRFFSFGFQLQQYLPLAVLKPASKFLNKDLQLTTVATVLTACGIETDIFPVILLLHFKRVATVLTACGIETFDRIRRYVDCICWLQQYLPRTVLNRILQPKIPSRLT